MDIRCLSSQTARTAGDALRELDAMQVSWSRSYGHIERKWEADFMQVLNPENPFILVHSPIISNYDISKMVEAHKKRREVDKNIIMTMGVGRGGRLALPLVFRKLRTDSRPRRHPESPILLVHPPSSRLLHYHPRPLLPSQKRFTIPSSLFTDPYPTNMDTFQIWAGPTYRDLGIDICEADVPALCTENFDYHDLRRHFVNGVLTSELLGKRIGVHLVGQEGEGGRYVERIRDTRTFGGIT
jgi:translation initiation factor eIF-2B subunit epsilon